MAKHPRLRPLKNSEYDEVEALLRATGVNIDDCPTCGSKLEHDEDGGFYSRENGTYRYKGEEHECDCERQIALRNRYVFARIPQQYMRLDWADYDGSSEARELVQTMLDKWKGFDKNGVGAEFCGEGLGTGKTFAATHIGKELIKRRVPVRFVAFRDLVRLFSNWKGDDEEIEKIKSVRVLILDEVMAGFNEGSSGLFADHFEAVIRHRTNWNLITIMTTNLEEGRLYEAYPRVFSLLEAKQARVVMKGDDQRMGKIGLENMELAANLEVRPIT